MKMRRTENFCKFHEVVISSTTPILDGAYLDCDIPISKLDFFANSTGLDEINIWKYCTGNMKEKFYEGLGGFFG